jgi:hypothetical protein
VTISVDATKERAMRRILLSVAVAILSLGLVASVHAGPKGGSGGGHGGKNGKNGGGHMGDHGKGHGDHKGMHSFKGRHGHRWGERRFDRRYGTRIYFNADAGRWYYWCPPDDCFYPVDYCPYGTYSWDDDGDD